MRALASDMQDSFEHVPVMRDEVLQLATSVSPKLIVDCTVGGAGHARALLEAFPEAHLIALDRDPAAIAAAKQALQPFADRVTLRRARFSNLGRELAECDRGQPDLVLADFGVSSHQLDTAERGFSFQQDGPLDMRMDPDDGEPVAELIGRLSLQRLAQALRTLGEERYAPRVARRILDARPTTTLELARLVRDAVPAGRQRINPATRTFQALRMLVNQELEEITSLCEAIPEILANQGMMLAISFHSLEDRAVKQAFRRHANPCTCPPSMPICGCGKIATLEVVTRQPITAGSDEVQNNPRSRSAKLRAARRLPRSE